MTGLRDTLGFALSLLLVLPACGDDGAGSDTDGGTATTGGESSTGTDGDSSSGSGGGNVYPPCTFDPQPQCDAPFDVCQVFGGGSAPHHCTYTCETVADCPAPLGGTAELLCEGAMPICVLDCSAGDCPDGMSCALVGPGLDIQRCAYNP